MKRVAMLTAVALGTLLVLAVLWEFRGAVLLFALSLAVAEAVRPVVDRLIARGWHKMVALLSVYLIGLMLAGSLLAAASWSLTGELHRAFHDFVQLYKQVADHWMHAGPWQQSLARRMPPADEFVHALAGQHGGDLLRAVAGTASSVLGFLIDFVFIVILSMYWTLDRVHFERLWLSLLPSSVRSRGRDTARAIKIEVGAYIRSEVVQSLIAGLMLWVGYRALGLPYPTLAAVVAAAAWLLPWAGAALAPSGLLLLSAPVLALGDTSAVIRTASAALLTAVVLLGLEWLVEPRLFNRRRYDSLLMVFAAIAMADLFGIFGLLVGPLLEVALQVFVEKWLAWRAAAPQPENLEQRLLELRAASGTAADLSPQLGNIMDRLEALLAEARDSWNVPGEIPSLSG